MLGQVKSGQVKSGQVKLEIFLETKIPGTKFGIVQRSNEHFYLELECPAQSYLFWIIEQKKMIARSIFFVIWAS